MQLSQCLCCENLCLALQMWPFAGLRGFAQACKTSRSGLRGGPFCRSRRAAPCCDGVRLARHCLLLRVSRPPRFLFHSVRVALFSWKYHDTERAAPGLSPAVSLRLPCSVLPAIQSKNPPDTARFQYFSLSLPMPIAARRVCPSPFSGGKCVLAVACA